MVRSIITLSILFLLAGQVDGQVVTLNRLQRAGGLGYIPYTDGTGKQGYTLLSALLSDYLTGTGTAGRIAAWGTADTLRSYIWEINDTYIRGSGTGWPQLQNGGLTWRGDTDLTISRTGADIMAFAAGGDTDPRMRISSAGIEIDGDANANYEWTINASGVIGTYTGGPSMYANSATIPKFTFNGDTDSGFSRSGADVVGVHAGDETNPSIKVDGVNNLITFDPDDDGTADVTVSATTLSTELLDIGTYGTTATKIAGVNASGVITQLTPGLRLSISGDSLIADAGVTGSGSASAVATWSSASALTFTDWLILSNVLQGPTLGDPAMSITDDAYSFTGDSNTGLKWSAADIVGIYAGDATNPLIKADGPGVAVTFDPDDDGVAEVTINATTMTTELLDIGTYGTTATKIAGLNASGVVTELVAGDGLSISGDSLITGRGFGQLAYNGEFEITNTSSDTLDPGFSWAEIEVGLISTDDATHSITTNYAGYAEFMFSTVLFNESGGTFTGAVNFELYKNGSYLAPFFGYTERLENNESKIVTVTGMLSVASGDDFHIRAYLSSAGTIDISRPVFNMKKI